MVVDDCWMIVADCWMRGAWLHGCFVRWLGKRDNRGLWSESRGRESCDNRVKRDQGKGGCDEAGVCDEPV